MQDIYIKTKRPIINTITAYPLFCLRHASKLSIVMLLSIPAMASESAVNPTVESRLNPEMIFPNLPFTKRPSNDLGHVTVNNQTVGNYIVGNQLTGNQTDNTNESFDINGTFMVTAYSPAQPIHEFLNDWDAPLDRGDIAYAQARAEVGIQKGNSRFSYGLGWRYDYLLSFNEATSEVYWRYKNKSNPNQNKQYPLILEASHNERIGANIGYDYPMNPSLNIRTKANIWYGLHAVQGKIDGQLMTNTLSPDSDSSKLLDSIANLDANIDYYYDEPALHEERLDWHPDKPDGYGYSFDILLDGKINDNTTFAIAGYDLLGRMHWKDMPSTRYNLDYDTARRPLYNLEGQLSKQNETQTLPWRVEADVVHTLSSIDKDNWQVGIHAQANDIEQLYQLSTGYQFDYQQTPIVITGLIEPQTDSLGLMIQSDSLGFKVITDDINFDDAKRTELAIYGHYQW